jgi:hypothetical protein
VGRRFVIDALKAAAQIKLRGLRRISGEARFLKVHRSVFQELFYQSLADSLPSRSRRDVNPAQSTDTGRGVGVARDTADADQLAMMKDAQKALTWLIKPVCVVVPLGDKPRQEPKPFGNGVCFQPVDLLGEDFQSAYRTCVMGGGHNESP